MRMKEATIKELDAIKKYEGFEQDSEAIRFLIRNYYKQVSKKEDFRKFQENGFVE